MAYEWDGMRKIPWGAVVEMFDGKNLTGCYYLHPDGTETEIGEDYTWQDILKHHENGGEFGLEKEK